MITVVFAFLAGLLTILAPCTLPVVPLVLGGATGGGRRRIAAIGIGFAASFVLVTVVFAAVFGAVGWTTSGLRLGAAAVLGLVGLSLAWPRLAAATESLLGPVATRSAAVLIPVGPAGAGSGPRLGSPAGTGLVIGAGIGLIWAPCVGPIMASVIAAAAVSGPSALALAIASAYVVGALVPLLAIARWGRRLTASAGGGRTARVRRGFGLAMAVAALAIVTGLDVPLQAGLTAALPPTWGSTLFAFEQQPAVQEDLTVLRPSDAPTTNQVPLEDLGPAPELTGITAWINSEPKTIAALRGKVVLVHFWTFGCINCIHVQPYVKAWYERYVGQGFVVLGVHTPELSFERDLDNVRDAVAQAGVRFPVAIDPSYATWNAYRNSYWPAFYFVDKSGRIRHTHFGEGDYDGSEAVIRELLAEPAPA